MEDFDALVAAVEPPALLERVERAIGETVRRRRGEEGDPVEALRHGPAGQLEDRRHDVDEARGAADDARGPHPARRADEQRDADQFVEESTPVDEGAVLGERLAVIGDDDDRRAVGERERLEPVEDASDLTVDRCQRRLVVGPQARPERGEFRIALGPVVEPPVAGGRTAPRTVGCRG